MSVATLFQFPITFFLHPPIPSARSSNCSIRVSFATYQTCPLAYQSNSVLHSVLLSHFCINVHASFFLEQSHLCLSSPRSAHGSAPHARSTRVRATACHAMTKGWRRNCAILSNPLLSVFALCYNFLPMSLSVVPILAWEVSQRDKFLLSAERLGSM